VFYSGRDDWSGWPPARNDVNETDVSGTGMSPRTGTGAPP